MIGPRRCRVPIRGIVKRRFPSGKFRGQGGHAHHAVPSVTRGGVHPAALVSRWSLAGGPCSPLFPFSEFAFALQSFSGQSQLLTYCYIVVVIPYYLSLGWVGGKGSWEEGSRGLRPWLYRYRTANDARRQRYCSVGSIGNDLLRRPDSDDAIKSLIFIAFFSFVLILFRDVSPSAPLWFRLS